MTDDIFRSFGYSNRVIPLFFTQLVFLGFKILGKDVFVLYFQKITVIIFIENSTGTLCFYLFFVDTQYLS